MKVKIGAKTFDSSKQPIMVVLSRAEKSMITDMRPETHKLCVYPPGEDIEKIKQFMK